MAQHTRMRGLILLVLLLGQPLLAQVPTELGQPVSPDSWPSLLDQQKGKWTLITFWSVFCEPCLEEMPALVQIQQEFAPKNFHIVAVNTDTKNQFEQAAEIIRTQQLPFKHYYKEPGSDARFRAAVDETYAANPFSILLNPEGTRVATIPTAKNLEDWSSILSSFIQIEAAPPATDTPSEPLGKLIPTSQKSRSRSGLLSGFNPEKMVETRKPKSTPKTPFVINSPSWESHTETSGNLRIPFDASEKAHVILSTVEIHVLDTGGVQLGEWTPSKLNQIEMPLRKEPEWGLYTPGFLSIPISATSTSSLDDQPFLLRVVFQGCTDGENAACFPPEHYTLSGKWTWADNRLSARELQATWIDPLSESADIPNDTPTLSPASFEPETETKTPANEDGLLGVGSLKDSSIVERAFARSLYLVFFLAFLGGILTSFTPCVYPMIPATVAIFGAKEVKSKLAACSLAATYIMGVALSYSILGILAAAIGTIFGTMMENPWVISIVAGFYIILALSMLDVFVFYLPSTWVTAASKVNRKGYLGAFLMGLVSSVVFAPCGEPILLGILAWVAKTQSFFFGFWLLFVYAWGIGLLFFVIAVFSSSIQYLPKAGVWMVAVKDFFGLLLLGLALYWLHYILPPSWLWGLTTLYFLGVATFIQSRNSGFEGWSRTLLSFATLACLLLATIPLQRFAHLQGWLPNSPQIVATASSDKNMLSDPIDWKEGSPLTDLEKARLAGIPAIIKYRTNVCPKCDEIDREVFASPEVQSAVKRFVMIKVNLSELNSEIRELSRNHGIYVAPVIEFFDSQGNLLKEKTVADVLTAEDFLERIRDIS